VTILLGGSVVGLGVGVFIALRGRARRVQELTVPVEWQDRDTWRMPALNRLARPPVSLQRKVGLVTLRGYLLVAFVLVILKVVEIAIR
jgi:hypothetical protein